MKAFDPKWIALKNLDDTGIQFAIAQKPFLGFCGLNPIWDQCYSWAQARARETESGC